jgi:hypothetical protein
VPRDPAEKLCFAGLFLPPYRRNRGIVNSWTA